MHPIRKEIRYSIVLITMENKRKIKKHAVLRPNLSFLLKKCVLVFFHYALLYQFF